VQIVAEEQTEHPAGQRMGEPTRIVEATVMVGLLTQALLALREKPRMHSVQTEDEVQVLQLVEQAEQTLPLT